MAQIVSIGMYMCKQVCMHRVCVCVTGFVKRLTCVHIQRLKLMYDVIAFSVIVLGTNLVTHLPFPNGTLMGRA